MTTSYATEQGMQEALRRIHVCRENHQHWLDLGNLNLQELPEELFELDHVEVLNLNDGIMIDGDNETFVATRLHTLQTNDIYDHYNCFSNMPRLRKLAFSPKCLQCISNLAASSTLEYLDLGYCYWLSDLCVLSSLKQLSFLRLTWCKAVRNLEPLQCLDKLKALHIEFFSELSDISSLANLPKLEDLSIKCCDAIDNFIPIGEMDSLVRLVLSGSKKMRDISFLSPLRNLEHLDLSRCAMIRDLSSLASANKLTSLDMEGCTRLVDLTPLSLLPNLQELNLSYCGKVKSLPFGMVALLKLVMRNGESLETISGLEDAKNLDALNLSMCAKIDNIDVLRNLHCLTALDLSCCHQIDDFSPVASLVDLKTLKLTRAAEKSVFDMQIISKLVNLTVLELSTFERITSIEVIEQLHSISDLRIFWSKEFSNVNSFASLCNLQKVDISCCKNVEDVDALGSLPNLTHLNISYTGLKELPAFVLTHPSLIEVSLNGCDIDSVPKELLSQGESVSFGGTNCLPALRSHFQDLEHGSICDRHVKVFVLGDGRVGKTSIIRRLIEGLPPLANQKSTHGIEFCEHELNNDALSDPVRVQYGDFGGQDIYLGTHALFIKGKCVFIIAWDSETEFSEFHDDGLGHCFQNRGLKYWVEFVRSVNREAPILIVQNKCESHAAFRSRMHDFGADCFGIRECDYSALSDRNRSVLDATLAESIEMALGSIDSRKMGIGRHAVRKHLRDLADDGHKLINLCEYYALCGEYKESISNPDLLVQYLHDTGCLFYDREVFADQAVLDLRWACDAIYCVLNREAAYRYIVKNDGQFDLSDLRIYAWQDKGYKYDEMRLFVKLMQECKACFKISYSPEIFLAPELLPAKSSQEERLSIFWDRQPRDVFIIRLQYPFLHPGRMHQIQCHLGVRYGRSAIYWKGGMFVQSKKSDACILIEAVKADDSNAGTVYFHAKGSDRESFARQMVRNAGIGNRDNSVQWSFSNDGSLYDPFDPHELFQSILSPSVLVEESQPVLEHETFDSEPKLTDIRKCHEIFVSYCWSDDESVEDVDQGLVTSLCRILDNHGYVVVRDKEKCGYKASLSEFMDELGRSRAVIVIISESYLRSVNCMHELSLIYINKDMDQRMFPLVLPQTKIFSPVDRLDIVKYWQQRHDDLCARVSQALPDISQNGISSDLAKCRTIRNSVDEILGVLSDLNAATYEILAADDYALLRKNIDKRLIELSKPRQLEADQS